MSRGEAEGKHSPSVGSRVSLNEPFPFPGIVSPPAPGGRPRWHLLEPPGLARPCLLPSALLEHDPALQPRPCRPVCSRGQPGLSGQGPPSGGQAQEGHLHGFPGLSQPLLGWSKVPRVWFYWGHLLGLSHEVLAAPTPTSITHRRELLARDRWVPGSCGYGRDACPGGGPGPALEHSQGPLRSSAPPTPPSPFILGTKLLASRLALPHPHAPQLHPGLSTTWRSRPC